MWRTRKAQGKRGPLVIPREFGRQPRLIEQVIRAPGKAKYVVGGEGATAARDEGALS